MAREFASVRLSIWQDEDWRDLPRDAKLLYFTILTHPSLSHCGVIDWRPKRLANLIDEDTDEAWVEAAGMVLQARRFVIVDHATEEALVRTFIRNDGLMKQPLMAVGMAKAFAATVSVKLRGVLVHELIRLRADQPELKGWAKPEADALLAYRSVDPAECLPERGPKTLSERGPLTPSAPPTERDSVGGPQLLTTSTTTYSKQHATNSTPREAAIAAGFDEFWSLYPRSDNKKPALVAYTKALRRIGHLELVDQLNRQLADPNCPESTYWPHASTWLNNDRWTDQFQPRANPHTVRPSTSNARVSEAAAAGQRLMDSMNGHQLSRPVQLEIDA